MRPAAIPVTLPLLLADLHRGPRARVVLDGPGAPALHPEAPALQAASVAWARRLGLVDAAQTPHLERARIAWLPARAYPHGAAAALQIAADWTTLFCLLDDRIERMAGPAEVCALLATLLAGFAPHTPPTDDPYQRACVDLRERILAAGPAALERFRAAVRDLFAAFVTEASERASGHIPALDRYLPLREQTVGLHVEFVLGELVDAIDLTPAERADPRRRELARLASDLVGWANDLYTHEKEIEAGDAHNLVFVLARADHLPLAAAVDRAVAMHDEALARFLALAADPTTPSLHRYATMLTAWIRGHLDWGRETGRYAPNPT